MSLKQFLTVFLTMMIPLFSYALDTAEVVQRITAPQAAEEYQQNYNCYRLAQSLVPAGEVEGNRTLSWIPEGLNQTPRYQRSVTSSGMECFQLINQGANDFAWGLGAERLHGCFCQGPLVIIL